MKKLLFLVLGLLLCSAFPAVAADNYAATEGSGKTFRCVDVGGVCYVVFVPSGGAASTLAAGAIGAAVPTGAVFIGATDGTNLQALKVDGSNNLLVSIQACASGVCGVTDGGSITNISPVGGKVQTSAPTYSNNEGRPPSMTIAGAWWNDQHSWAGTALGAPSNFGTSPGAVAVPGVNAALFYGSTAASVSPCLTNTPTSAAISITSATTTRIIAPSASNKTYICYMYLQTGAANNIAIVEGTGGTCGTGTAGIVGGTTAANGLNNAANSGQVFQNGGRVVLQTAGTNVDLCLITSSAGPVAGVVRYVQAP